jgi:Mrp family chromosome partitioning ATPase
MLRFALLTSDVMAADAIEQMLQDSGMFELVHRSSAAFVTEADIRTVSAADPDVILLQINAWPSPAASQLATATRRGALVGFRTSWSEREEKSFAEAGIVALLHEPFSPSNLEKAAYHAVHRRQPLTNQNIFAFLPSKAGSGCSTVALNTAAVLANDLGQRTLLMETDRRSGTLSILLNVEGRGGLAEVLASSRDLTPGDWSQHVVSTGKLDLLLANPFSPGAQPSWVNYYQMLLFAQKRYDFIVVDLPEVVNPATAELASAAQKIFVVCEPQLPSLKLVPLRRIELESCGVPTEKIFVLGNRWEPGSIKAEDVVRTANAPMFAVLPNDYEHVKDAALESRTVSRNSAFGNACADLARRLANVPGAEASKPVSGLFKRFIKTP